MQNLLQKLKDRNGATLLVVIFLTSLVAIFLIPIINLAPQYQTFIHSFRPEIAIGFYVLGFSIWAFRDKNFQRFVGTISPIEIVCIMIPLTLMIIWSGLSMTWAPSPGAALHHTCVWICYSSFYLLARYVVTRNRSAEPVIYAIVIFAAIVCLPAVVEYDTLLLLGEVPNLGARYAKYAELINVLCPVLIAYSLSAKGKAFYISTVTIILIFLFDVATVSRIGIGVFLFVATATFAVTLLIKRFRYILKRSVLLIAMLLVAMAAFISIGYLAAGSIPIADRVQSENNTASTNSRPFFIAIGHQMWSENKITGIGADNFGREFSVYRSKYAELNPNDPNLRLGFLESGYPERAHNEYVQILAELGIVGAALFAFFLAGIGYIVSNIFRRKFRVSLPTIAAFIGLAGFLASSLVSSYSFRLPQNGVAFFFVLAIGVSGVLRRPAKDESPVKTYTSLPILLGLTISLAGSIALIAYSSTRLAAVHLLLTAEEQQSLDEAMPYYTKALALDQENGHLFSSIGGNLMINDRANEAPFYLRKAIEVGRSTSIDYSYLATAQIIAGDRTAAISTLREGIGVYPFSVFLRSRLAVALKDNGQTEESSAEFSRAKQIDEKQALVWYKYIDSGGDKASMESFEKGLPPLMELKPQVAIYAIKRERELRFPDEKVVIPPH